MITGLWRWWASFALAEFALIYCYPGTLFVLIVLNLATVVLIASGKGFPESRRALSSRWFCVNVLAAALVPLKASSPAGRGSETQPAS